MTLNVEHETKNEIRTPKVIMKESGGQIAQLLATVMPGDTIDIQAKEAWDAMLSLAKSYCDGNMTVEELKQKKPSKAATAKVKAKAKPTDRLQPAAATTTVSSKAASTTTVSSKAASSKAASSKAASSKAARAPDGDEYMQGPKSTTWFFEDMDTWEWEPVCIGNPQDRYD